MQERVGGFASLDAVEPKQVYFRLASNLAEQYMADVHPLHELQLISTLLLALRPGADILRMRAEVPPHSAYLPRVYVTWMLTGTYERGFLGLSLQTV